MRIVSSDTVFAEAIQIALRTAGMNAEIVSALPDQNEEELLWILDLDTVPPPSPMPPQAITLSRSDAASPDLIRPFLFRDLITLAKERSKGVADISPLASAAASPQPLLQLIPDGVLLRGRPIALTPSEHALLALLMDFPNECVPLSKIDALWQEKGGNTSAVYIRYLRKKIDEPAGLRLIRTVRGRGYRLCLPK